MESSGKDSEAIFFREGRKQSSRNKHGFHHLLKCLQILKHSKSLESTFSAASPPWSSPSSCSSLFWLQSSHPQLPSLPSWLEVQVCIFVALLTGLSLSSGTSSSGICWEIKVLFPCLSENVSSLPLHLTKNLSGYKIKRLRTFSIRNLKARLFCHLLGLTTTDEQSHVSRIFKSNLEVTSFSSIFEIFRIFSLFTEF